MRSTVPGLRYIPEYLEQEDHDRLLTAADGQPWQPLGERRVQAHGYSYDKTKGGNYRVGELPPWAREMAARLWRDGLMPTVADQMIVNEYEPGSGISPHVDATFFDEVIVSLSLGSTCIIEFTASGSDGVELLLEPRSALVMSGEARSRWMHAVPARRFDLWQGRELRRARRVSLTFRTMRQVPPAPAHH
jgi:alkylated DNA repair dioxygenase AlkB